MMKIDVSHAAKANLKEIRKYIKLKNSKDVADNFIDEIKKLIKDLEENPNWGSYVKELNIAGKHYYRQLHHKSYRIIYSVVDDTVFVHLVIDGRRDLDTILKQIFLNYESN